MSKDISLKKIFEREFNERMRKKYGDNNRLQIVYPRRSRSAFKCVLVEETFKNFPKEEKKMTISRKNFRKLPYLKVQVVPVKKKNDTVQITASTAAEFAMKILELKNKKSKPRKGNWVNDENLDKIQFPCFCRHDNGLGILVKTLMYYTNKEMYTLHHIDYQTNNVVTSFESREDLEELIKYHNIHILKAKIVLFEEE